MNASHLLEGFCYVCAFIFVLCWLCVMLEPFPADEPVTMDLGTEWGKL
jgi:hypothetical protein